MGILSLILVFLFDITLCYFEVPKMLKNKMHRELWVFFVILFAGTLSAVLRAIDRNLVPNPTEWVMFVYEPIGTFFKELF
ncbi:MAG: hypothetical protein GX285_05675 [Clostridiales bacterium]|nr:hypothetical protein [Clostridiales bacterium]